MIVAVVLVCTCLSACLRACFPVCVCVCTSVSCSYTPTCMCVHAHTHSLALIILSNFAFFYRVLKQRLSKSYPDAFAGEFKFVIKCQCFNLCY